MAALRSRWGHYDSVIRNYELVIRNYELLGLSRNYDLKPNSITLSGLKLVADKLRTR